MKISIACILTVFFLTSCWKYYHPTTLDPSLPVLPVTGQKILGYKPIYGNDSNSKSVVYSPGAHDVLNAGNIYAYKNFIFQLDAGYGIHVIDNSIPSQAHLVGFITVKGCSQIAIKDDLLYTNCYDDLVVLDFSNLNHMREYSRPPGVFKEYRYGSPISTPPTAGYFECPRYD